MNVAFYSAAAGMLACQEKLDVTANNMANVNTTGYKNMEVSFQDLMYTDMNTKAEGEHKTGHGSHVAGVDSVFLQGVLEKTDRPLDFAVAGKAYFAIDDGSGTTSYTRDGSFRIGMSQGAPYLMNAVGGFVLDGNGNKIQVPVLKGTTTPDVNALKGQIGLYTFENPSGLTMMGNNLCRVSENSGTAVSVKSSEGHWLVSGALEASMADTATEMIHVIESQRALQMNARIVTSADEVEEMINNLR
ncbi:flagellar hook-basal body protein [Faecalicatena sp. AGMB00832]|uniref:Flagellar hook-basal body protein n=1 Tax=Faecalicatena faecalis TaxID=2726362 RepID=A0ABS6D9M8_9FIRM|nr:flagellar hook-basal body protein [Faecalicatena faecalis]MBU3878159.1 flagellar hook-basal body protein [Faecalicatena faecalis]